MADDTLALVSFVRVSGCRTAGFDVYAIGDHNQPAHRNHAHRHDGFERAHPIDPSEPRDWPNAIDVISGAGQN